MFILLAVLICLVGVARAQITTYTDEASYLDRALVRVLPLVNRIVAGPFLLLISAYLALLAPSSRQWTMHIVFLLLCPLFGVGSLWCSIRLQLGMSGAYVAEGLWVAGLLVVVVALDRVFERRGIRSA